VIAAQYRLRQDAFGELQEALVGVVGGDFAGVVAGWRRGR
jgi:hypothetical protein